MPDHQSELPQAWFKTRLLILSPRKRRFMRPFELDGFKIGMFRLHIALADAMRLSRKAVGPTLRKPRRQRSQPRLPPAGGLPRPHGPRAGCSRKRGGMPG